MSREVSKTTKATYIALTGAVAVSFAVCIDNASAFRGGGFGGFRGGGGFGGFHGGGSRFGDGGFSDRSTDAGFGRGGFGNVHSASSFNDRSDSFSQSHPEYQHNESQFQQRPG